MSRQQLNAIQNNTLVKTISGFFGTGKTTVGRLLLENEKFSTAIYVVFSKTVNNSSLQEDAKKNFKSKNENCQLLTFSRSECLSYFEIQDNDDDGLNIINQVMLSPKMESNMSIFFDETPISRPKGQYDWSLLKNPKPDSLLVVAFQPMVEAKNKNINPIKPILPSPTHANVELTRCYRTTASIFHSLESIKQLGMKMIKTTPEGVNFVSGGKPLMMNFREPSKDLITWINFKLTKMNCDKDNVKILCTDNTENDAKEIFKDSSFSCDHWKTFIGCEVPVVVCFYSSELDQTWQLLNMTSRAQQQVRTI